MIDLLGPDDNRGRNNSEKEMPYFWLNVEGVNAAAQSGNKPREIR